MLATLLSLLARGGGAGPLVQALVHAQQRPYLTMASRAAQPPALHGPVHKVGPINMTLFYPPVAHPCKVERLRWYVAAAAAADNETAAPAAELRHGPCLACQVFANHLFKIIYLRHAKVASSTVLDYFGLCNNEHQGCLHPLETNHAALNTSAQAAARPCFARLSTLRPAEVDRMWRNYTVFTVIRDPYDRAVSQYQFLMRSNLGGSRGCRAASNQQVHWDSFCAHPPSLALFCARRPDCCKQDDEGKYDGVAWKLAHIAPQAPCVAAPGGGLAVDFVVRQEHLSADLARLLAYIDARRDAGVPPLRPSGQLGSAKMRPPCAPGQRSRRAAAHGVAEMRLGSSVWQGMVAKEQYCSRDEYYSRRHSRCRASLAAYFAQDFQLIYGDSASGRL